MTAAQFAAYPAPLVFLGLAISIGAGALHGTICNRRMRTRDAFPSILFGMAIMAFAAIWLSFAFASPGTDCP